MKTKKKTFLKSILLVILALSMLLGVLAISPMRASAATNRAGAYMLYGSYTTDDGTYSGYMNYFKIQIGTQYFYDDSSASTYYNDKVYNWSYFTFYIHAGGDIKEHTSFMLTRNGNTYTSKSLSGSSGMYLYKGSLPDGNYVLTYKGTYKYNILFSKNYTFTYRFSVDTTAPTGTVKGGSYTIADNGYTNQAITYSVSDAHPYRIYYCSPSSSSYTYTTATSKSVSATTANNGWWSFYATDAVSNSTTVQSVYLDTVAPVGSVISSGGSDIGNGGAVNKGFQYKATDKGGVSYCQIKNPGSSSWTTYTSGTLVFPSQQGWTTFRSVDKAGNISEEFKVYYDSTKPVGYLYGGTTEMYDGSYTNADYVKFNAGDGHSGINKHYVKMPNSSYYTEYIKGTHLSTEGTYYFYAYDKAYNYTPTVSITLDKTAPSGTLYSNSSAIASGSKTNASYISFSPYDNIALGNTYVKKPGNYYYETYYSDTPLYNEGEYNFYSVDLAGNVSDTFTVTIDREIPSAQLYVDGKTISSGSYTNGEHISFECAEKCFVQLPGSTSFVEYLSGAEYYKPGKYIFYGVSDAGNSTGYYTVIIDRTVKNPDVLNVVDAKTNGDVTISWTDGDAELYAPVISATVNGKPYTNGETIYTIDTGIYKVTLTDAAGNTWNTEFTSEKKNVLTDTLQKEYYEAHNSDGEYYSFSTYDNALAYATERENGYVRTGEWKSASWDAGIAMDTVDSVNSVNGTYYVYKKSDNPNEEVAYFTIDRLNEVIAEYAKADIIRYYYWEKEPVTAANGENLYSYSDSKNILAGSVALGENIGTLLDEQEFVGDVIETEGNHTLTVFDKWDNSCEYNLTVICKTPGIEYAVGSGSNNPVTFDRTYYFKDQVTVSINDIYDEMAMFCVYDENGNAMAKLSIGETYTLSDSGSYKIVAVNHAGESEEFVLLISRNAPEIEIKDNKNDKQLQVTVKESTDKESHIQTLNISKSADGGNTWMSVDTDDYGTPIAVGTYSYKFRTTGLYKVTVTDEFRTGIDAITAEQNYAQEKPAGTLSGVENGGYTNSKVTFKWADEATVSLTKDGVAKEYRSGDELSEDGKYVLTIENFDGYKETYSFTIDTVKPEVKLQGTAHGRTAKDNVAIYYSGDNVSAELIRNGESLGSYASGTTITEDGEYRIIVKDLANNTVENEFTIDKTVDYDINVNDKGLSNSVMATANEQLTAILTKNGEVVEYTLGDAITDPADYILTLTDSLGNASTVSFAVVKPSVKSFIHNFDEVAGFERVLVNGEDKRLNYGTLELTEDGVYEVGVIVSGETYLFNITVDNKVPNVTLKGVELGGKTKDSVIISAVSEQATLVLRRDGEVVKYKLGEQIIEVGEYRITVTDECGNTAEYGFTINADMTGLIVTSVVLVVIVALAGVGIAVFFIIKKKQSV